MFTGASSTQQASGTQEAGVKRRHRRGCPVSLGTDTDKATSIGAVCHWVRKEAGPSAHCQFTVGTWLWCRLNSLALRRRLAMLLAMLTPGVAGLEPPGL